MENKTATILSNEYYRVRMMAASAFGQVMSEHRRDLDTKADAGELTLSDIQDVAMETALLALRKATYENAELLAVRAERDHYLRVALHAINLKPISLTVPADMVE